ncbi:MAG: hypothetical protein KDB27_19380, partial [Planctomycetales bacterium]|nr:hypothetical protein [Planctomycetales bacterium]
MTTNSLRVVVVFFVAASVARADLQLHETGVFADAASVNGESIFQTTSHPSSVVFQGSQLFSGGPTPPDVDTSSFFGSAVISSDASLASLISVEQKNVTSVIPGGAKRDISTGAGAQTGFSIQNASSDQVTVQVQFQSSPTLVVPTTGPSNSKAETGASVSISILDGTNVLTPISSFFGFASLDNTGSVTL